MIRTIFAALGIATLMSTAALADDIEGRWKTESGDTAAIGGCGEEFCITLKSGQYSGRTIGRMMPTGGGNYEGSITKPSNNKTYSGKARLTGNSLKLSGCVLGGLICDSQVWARL
jgi:uncharacterized protein (DUF2147 family)